MNNEKKITVSFTGHRDCDNLDNEALCEAIRTLYRDGYRIFLCGMARGFDLAAGECVLSLQNELSGLQLRCIIPFRGHDKSFSKADRERYQQLTLHADQVITLSEGYQAGAYHFRNDYLVDNSSAIIAYYNGSRGGTHYTLHRAVKRGLRIVNICLFRLNELFSDLK